MRDTPFRISVKHREMRVQSGRDVVGVEDRDLGGAREAFAAHHQNVDIGDRQDRRGTVRGRRNRTDRRLAVGGMPRQERLKMRSYADRTHAWAATAMWNAEGLVQVEMA